MEKKVFPFDSQEAWVAMGAIYMVAPLESSYFRFLILHIHWVNSLNMTLPAFPMWHVGHWAGKCCCVTEAGGRLVGSSALRQAWEKIDFYGSCPTSGVFPLSSGDTSVVFRHSVPAVSPTLWAILQVSKLKYLCLLSCSWTPLIT